VHACKATMGKLQCMQTLADACKMMTGTCKIVQCACKVRANACMTCGMLGSTNRIHHDTSEYICTCATHIKANIYLKILLFTSGNRWVDLVKVFLCLGYGAVKL